MRDKAPKSCATRSKSRPRKSTNEGYSTWLTTLQKLQKAGGKFSFHQYHNYIKWCFKENTKTGLRIWTDLVEIRQQTFTELIFMKCQDKLGHKYKLMHQICATFTIQESCQERQLPVCINQPIKYETFQANPKFLQRNQKVPDVSKLLRKETLQRS